MTLMLRKPEELLSGLTSVKPARRSVARQCLMLMLLILMSGIIVAYLTLTDPVRLQAMAETYLSKLVGARVEVGKAKLSIFEGLRLEQVTVWVDPHKPGEPEAPDGRIFTARVLVVWPSPKTVLTGSLESTQITALDPQIRICEDMDHRSWNYQRLLAGIRRQNQKDSSAATRQSSGRPMTLPEIRLRGGMIELARIEHGRWSSAGQVSIEGNLIPKAAMRAREAPDESENQYQFDLESRAPGQATGARLGGTIDLDQGSLEARLENLQFDSALMSMLPSEVQQVCRAHQLAGMVRVPVFRFSPGRNGAAPDFLVELELVGVKLAVLPRELLGSEYESQALWRPGYRLPPSPLIHMLDRSSAVARAARPEGIELRDVSGRLRFTPRGFEVLSVRGTVEGNHLCVDGSLNGYGADATGRFQIAAYNLYIPPSPRWLGSIPQDVREQLEKYRPAGRGHAVLWIDRVRMHEPVWGTKRPGHPVSTEVSGELVIVDGGVEYDEFPYPMAHGRGVVIFGRYPQGHARAGQQFVEIHDVHGKGAIGTPNQDTDITVDGFVSPLDHRSQVEIRVTAGNVRLDPTLRRSLPKDARDAIALFDTHRPDGTVIPAQMHGGFSADIRRPFGYRKKLSVDVDLKLDHAQGTFSEFPYPLDNVSGRLLISLNETRLIGVVARDGDTSIRIDGNVLYGNGQGVEPHIHVNAQRVPLDSRLLDAVQSEQRERIRKIGLTGLLNIEGDIYPREWAVDPDNLAGLAHSTDVEFRLNVGLSQGRLWPVGSDHLVRDLSANLDVYKDRMDLKWATGRVGDGEVHGHGHFAWPRDRTSFSLNVDATNVALDKPLYQIATQKGRETWDSIRPSGAVDLAVSFSGGIDEDEESPARASDGQNHFAVTIRPRRAAINPVWFPWPMQGLEGEVTISDQGVSLKNISARHGDATLSLEGRIDPGMAMDLVLNARRIVVDDAFRLAVPEGLRSSLDAVKFSGGSIDLEHVKIGYPRLVRAEEEQGPTTRPVIVTVDGVKLSVRDYGNARTVRNATVYDDCYEFDGRLAVNNASMDVGMLLSGINASADLTGTISKGELLSISGKIDAPVLSLAGRPVSGFKTRLLKRVARDYYQFYNLEGNMAGGRMGGQIDLAIPKAGPARYAVQATFRGLDVRKLVADPAGKFRGEVEASIDLAGDWSDPSTRQGRGYVSVRGEDLYTLPAMTGLLQITNLALPIKSPFELATTSYAVRGNRILFEQIELCARSMVMQGVGWVDFAAKKFDLTFTTYNPGWGAIGPFKIVPDELFQIRAKGSVNEPQIKAQALPIFTTTIDEMFSGKDAQRHGQEKKNRRDK